jgi:hypothetical protein
VAEFNDLWMYDTHDNIWWWMTGDKFDVYDDSLSVYIPQPRLGAGYSYDYNLSTLYYFGGEAHSMSFLFLYPRSCF